MNYTSSNLASLKRLHAQQKSLTELAAEYAVRMKCKLPDEPIEDGRLYQLAGKQLHGVDCMALLVIPNRRAIVIDLSTGIVGSIDKFGIERASQIGGRQQ